MNIHCMVIIEKDTNMHKIWIADIFTLVVDKIPSKIEYVNSNFQVTYHYVLLNISLLH